MDVPVAIPLQTGWKGASAAQTTAAAILAAKAAREAKIWYHPGNLLKSFAKQVSGRYIVETYLVDRKARASALASPPLTPRSPSRAGDQGGVRAGGADLDAAAGRGAAGVHNADADVG